MLPVGDSALQGTNSKLRLVKLAHTVIWALLAGCVVAIPALAMFGLMRFAALLIAVVLLEVVVLAVNGLSCPLTAVAAKYTTDRRANFDIYLPEWLAKHNKEIFGSLYVLGLVVTAVCWNKGS